MGQMDPSFGGYFYPNQMGQMNPLPNPTLAGNAAINVDLSDYPTPQELEPQQNQSKMDSNTETTTAATAAAAGDNNGELEKKGNGEEMVVEKTAADPVDPVAPTDVIPK